MNKKLLQSIPKVDELLTDPLILPLLQEVPPAVATKAVRECLAALRTEILSGACQTLPDTEEQRQRIEACLVRYNTPSLRRVINATGVILHTNLGRAPLAAQAVQAISEAARGYSTLEYDVKTAARGSRYSHVTKLLTELTGAKDALVVNNNAAAVLLILSSLAKNREVVVSRSELVEIGGAFRVPEIMAQSGCILKEVGTTNRTHPEDYARAIDLERTGAVLKVHTSNYRISGFTAEVSLSELTKIGRRHQLPVIYDLGSGALLPLQGFGIQDEPCVTDCVASGADIVSFSGDKLLGGAQAGIILGSKPYIDRMKQNPLTRAIRIDKLTLAALEATLRLYADPDTAIKSIPVYAMLSASQASLREKAQRLIGLTGSCGAALRVVDTMGQMGGGSLPTRDIPGAAVEVQPESVSVNRLEAHLRSCEPPVIARISHDRLLLEMRCLDEHDFPHIAAGLRAGTGGNA